MEIQLEAAPVVPPLASWKEGPSKQSILNFVDESVAGVPVEDRVAVFDNDGTLWCERPMPIQADFIIRRLTEMAEENAQLRRRQPRRLRTRPGCVWSVRMPAKNRRQSATPIVLFRLCWCPAVSPLTRP